MNEQAVLQIVTLERLESLQNNYFDTVCVKCNLCLLQMFKITLTHPDRKLLLIIVFHTPYAKFNFVHARIKKHVLSQTLYTSYKKLCSMHE